MTDYDAWAKTVLSDARLNRMTVIPNSGINLAALDKTLHGLLICTADGGSLTKDHVYLCSADGTTLIDISGTSSHTHSSSTDGGSIIDIYKATPKIQDLNLIKTNDLDKANWIASAVTGTGSVENKTDGTTGERSIRLRPNATSGSQAQISYPCLKLDFSKRSIFQAKLQIETASSLALHSGVNCDDITAADSNTIKYNAEICTATNNNWFLRTASGSANSTSDTGIAMTANRVAIKIEHLPDLGTPEADLYIDAASAFQKTTNIPVTGATADANLIKHSIKNSTAADRPLLMYGSRIRYTVSDNWV